MIFKKYFLAIVIPSPLFELIEEIKQKLFLDYGLKGPLRSPSHITLHRPFIWKENKENLLIEKIEKINFYNEFKIGLNNFSFFEPRVIYIDVLPSNDLLNLHKIVKQFAKSELKILNEVNDLRGFHPHVTVAARDLKKAQFYELVKHFDNLEFKGSFVCSKMCLLKLEKKWDIVKTFNFISQ